jgi:hypothetical protein
MRSSIPTSVRLKINLDAIFAIFGASDRDKSLEILIPSCLKPGFDTPLVDHRF